MYIVGHCVITAACNQFDRRDVYGEPVAALMLPDFARCHDWGYEHCFLPLRNGIEAALIRAHILGDWFVHFGRGREMRKEGWAYRSMGVYAQAYDRFFDKATRRGFRKDGPPEDSRRGFAHSMVEYSIDTWLCRQHAFDDVFDSVKLTLGCLGRDDGRADMRWLEGVLDREGIPRTPGFVGDVESFRRRVAASTAPEEFAYRAAALKFGLAETPESLDFIAGYIDEGLKQIGTEEVAGVVSDAGAFVGEYLSLLGAKREDA